MTIYVDGDAFVNALKPILLKAVNRLALKTYAISNKKISLGKSDYVEYILVDQGADKADDLIAQMVKDGDLVITADIPLADRVISKNAFALGHRGELFDKENIKQLLAMRNLMAEIRDTGEITKGPAPFSKKDVSTFANGLNAFLQRKK